MIKQKDGIVNRPLRVNIVLPYAGIAGGVRVAAIYAERLWQRGHKVCVISTQPQRVSYIDQFCDFIKRREIRTRTCGQGLSHMDGLNVDWRVVDHMGPITDCDVPDGDVIIATWWKTAEWVNGLSHSKGVQVYFVQDGLSFVDGLQRPEVKARADATWRMPMYKITISKWIRDAARDQYKIDRLPIIYNSVDTDLFHAIEREMGAPPTIGVLYSRHHLKGVAVSLRAIELARKVSPDIKVMMFGAESEHVDVSLPPYAQLFVRPAQEKIRDIYSQCDFWLCGSYSEGFHLPPLEAMACGVPVVSTLVGGPADIVREGENGFLSPIGDAEALGENLIKALSCTPDEWAMMSAAARKTATDYTWEDATDLFEGELYRVVESGPLAAKE